MIQGAPWNIGAGCVSALQNSWKEVVSQDPCTLSARTCLLLSLLIVLLIFPDVILGSGSLSMIDMSVAAGQEWPGHTILHLERPGRYASHGFWDTGGTIYQSEPAQQFLRYVLLNLESPYWNPYSATGALGPETLVDNKFSPFAFLVAMLGGGSTAYHVALFAIYVSSIYCLIRMATNQLGLSAISAMAGAIVFMLNGFAIANISSNISQAYFLFPILLYSLLAFAAAPETKRFVYVVLANSMVLAVTFLPTTLLTFISVYVVAVFFVFGRAYDRHGDWIGKVVTGCLWMGLSCLLALTLMAFLYLPIAESMFLTQEVSEYRARTVGTATFNSLLSLFTSKHLWESYNTMDGRLWDPKMPAYVGNVVFHLGISASVAACFAIRRWPVRQGAVVLGVGILFFAAVGRIFGVPGISPLFDFIPFIGSFGVQYIAIVAAIAFTLLCTFGFESLRQSEGHWVFVALVAFAIVGSLLYLTAIYELPTAGPATSFIHAHKYAIKALAYSFFSVAVLAVSIVLAYRVRQRKHIVFRFGARSLSLRVDLLLLGVLFFEMVFYMNTYRMQKSDVFDNPPAHVVFLRENIGDGRILSIGHYGLPAEFGSAYQIPQVGAMTTNILPWYLEMFRRNFPSSSPVDKFARFAMLTRTLDTPNLNEDLIDLLSVKYLAVSKTHSKHAAFLLERGYPQVFEKNNVLIFENLDPLPRALAVGRLLSGDRVEALSDYHRGSVAVTTDSKLIERAQALGIPIDSDRATAVMGPVGGVEILETRHAAVMIKATLNQPAILVLTENWHPNWRAWDNGAPIHVGRVNESFRGVALSPGVHRIEFRYRPATLTVALSLSFSAFVLIVLALLLRKRLNSVFVPFTRPESSL